MAFLGLYNEVTRVSTEPITVPTAAVLAHVLHLLMYRLRMYVPTVPNTVPTVRARATPTAVQ